MKVALGGERISSGKKMEVDLHAYGRSTHNLTTVRKTSMSAGTIVPIANWVATTADTFDIEIDLDVMTHPTIGPLFGSEKVEVHIYTAPVRLYQADLQIDSTDIGTKMDKVFLPQMWLDADALDYNRNVDNQQIGSSSIFKYLGISGLGSAETDEPYVKRRFNATSYLMYFDVYKVYYANKQEKQGAIIHNDLIANTTNIQEVSFLNGGNVLVLDEDQNPPVNVFIASNGTLTITATDLVEFDLEDLVFIEGERDVPMTEYYDMVFNLSAGTITGTSRGYRVRNFFGWRLNSEISYDAEPKVRMFDLKNIDRMRMRIMRHVEAASPFYIPLQEDALEPYNLPFWWRFREAGGTGGKVYSKLSSQEGLLLKAYDNDLFNNYLDTESIDGANGVNQLTAIDTSSGRVTLNALTLARKMYDMYNRILVAGNTYQDWQNAMYTERRMRSGNSPRYDGGIIKNLVFQEVISNAATPEQPLGTLGGRGKMRDGFKGGKVTVKVDEHSYIMAMVSITPRVNYSQGNTWDVNLKTMGDFHVPALDGIGFQDLVTDQMHFADTAVTMDETVVFRSAGKQPAYMNYMTDVDRNYGTFAEENNQRWMVLDRSYEIDPQTRRIADLTTYIDPKKYNNIFAYRRRDAQNYWVQVGFKVTARRLMSAKVMPNL